MFRRTEREHLVGVFVGKGDYVEQLSLAEQREAEPGWIVGGHVDTKRMIDALSRVPYTTFFLNGAHAGDCIPVFTKRALRKNAARIIIPLHEIMGGDYDDSDPLVGRARQLAWRLHTLNVIQDTRIVVTPSAIWQPVVAELMDSV